MVWAYLQRPRKLSHLVGQLPAKPDHTCLGDFLCRGDWDEDLILQQTALATLMSMNPQPGERVYLIVDETKTAKRAKKMDCVSRHYNPSLKTYATGHTFLRSALVFRGARIPWRISLMQSKPYCRRHGLPYQNLTARAS